MWNPRFRMTPPSIPGLKYAERKTRDFLGFYLFFSKSETNLLSMESKQLFFQKKYKMPLIA